MTFSRRSKCASSCHRWSIPTSLAQEISVYSPAALWLLIRILTMCIYLYVYIYIYIYIYIYYIYIYLYDVCLCCLCSKNCKKKCIHILDNHLHPWAQAILLGLGTKSWHCSLNLQRSLAVHSARRAWEHRELDVKSEAKGRKHIWNSGNYFHQQLTQVWLLDIGGMNLRSNA